MKVLIAVDDSAESLNAAETAHQMFGPAHEVTVLTVGEREPYVMTGYDANLFGSSAELSTALEEDALRRAQGVAAEASRQLPIDADVEIEVGSAAATICEVAGEQSSDVIVIGSHDKSFWERIFDPSVGRYLLDHSPCPVLVVR